MATANEEQIVGWVREIDRLTSETAEHWTMVRQSVVSGDLNHAISLLNAYFRLKDNLEGVESRLRSLLRGYYSDK